MTETRTAVSPAHALMALVLILPIMPALPFWTDNTLFAVTASPLYVFTVGALVMFSAWIWLQDRWLGALTAWVGIALLWTPTVHAFEVTEMLVLSACLLMMAEDMSPSLQANLVLALVVAGLFEVIYGVQQWIGYDVLWHGTQQIVPIKAIFGTLGNSNYYGVYLAMIAPLAPWWAVPFFVVGIILSHSLLAMGAVSLALLWRVRANRRFVIGGAVLAFASLVLIAALKGAVPLSGMAHRLAVWKLALDHLTEWQWLVGLGPGSWAETVPFLQRAAQIYPNEVFIQGHNEWIQLVYENGLVAMLCLSGWLWAHKRAWTGLYGPALVSVMVCSFGMFGVRLAITGCVALAILSLALSKEGEA